MAEVDRSSDAIDEVTRGHIRNLDHRLGHLASELVGGREKAVEEIRGEIAAGAAAAKDAPWPDPETALHATYA